jgi:hypothetical protein
MFLVRAPNEETLFPGLKPRAKAFGPFGTYLGLFAATGRERHSHGRYFGPFGTNLGLFAGAARVRRSLGGGGNSGAPASQKIFLSFDI